MNTDTHLQTRNVLLDGRGELRIDTKGQTRICLRGRDQRLRMTEIEFIPPQDADPDGLIQRLVEGQSIEAVGYFEARGPIGEKRFTMIAKAMEIRG